MGSLHGFYLTVLRKSFYIHWSAGRSPRVHEVNPGRDSSRSVSQKIMLLEMKTHGQVIT